MITLLGDAAQVARRQYSLLALYSFRSSAMLSWRKNEYASAGEDSDSYGFFGPNQLLVEPGQKVRLGYGHGYGLGGRPWCRADFLWPDRATFVFYRAFCNTFRKGRVAIVDGRASDDARAYHRSLPSEPIEADGMRIRFVERTEKRPRFEGVYVRSQRSWMGTFPNDSYMAVMIRGAVTGQDFSAPVSPYRFVARDYHFHPADMRQGIDLEVALWTTSGETVRWTLPTTDIHAAAIKARQRRTLFGRTSNGPSIDLTIEYWNTVSSESHEGGVDGDSH